MSARQEAVEAMSAELPLVEESLEDDVTKALFLLDLLSPELLARLAIESGALEQVGWVKPNGRLFTVHSDPVTHARETADPDWTPVFRMTEPQS